MFSTGKQKLEASDRNPYIFFLFIHEITLKSPERICKIILRFFSYILNIMAHSAGIAWVSLSKAVDCFPLADKPVGRLDPMYANPVLPNLYSSQ